ncbi:hypothetical protein BAUCODRAFT_119819 [Baudoinia panamericana UAMH 10762]|uniref:Amine oxidase domain-containing protein n=1 Tax=Baudoinia panamericana (strain UAMH 10762) TaxID=717646 RepID=M2NLB4_BAUPA|nr:uncharacterized protein BAUCODRAFT_119819 [Baudoinia panamericana UAMH 10762]EMD00275.1 hypothetical protein BAUCODRAFT_119819 [Baudoinia panamericana UAMH 10762]
MAGIGGGLAGLAVANYLLAKGLKVTLFESKNAAGGVQNTDQTDHRPGLVCNYRETNVPQSLMTFSDFQWPEGTSLFSKNITVKQYMQQYANQHMRE